MDNSKQEQNSVFSLGKDSLLQKRSLSVVQIPPSAPNLYLKLSLSRQPIISFVSTETLTTFSPDN